MKKVLVVVDMQNDFIDGSLGTKEARDIIPNVIEKIRNFDGDVYATMDTHKSDYLQTEEGKNLPVKHCMEGTKGWQIHPDVKTELEKRNAKIITKNTFGSVRLINELKKEDAPKAVELIGLCTDICVVSNALLVKANFPNIPISVDETCCAGVNPKGHEYAIETMKHCQIHII